MFENGVYSVSYGYPSDLRFEIFSNRYTATERFKELLKKEVGEDNIKKFKDCIENGNYRNSVTRYEISVMYSVNAKFKISNTGLISLCYD